ncbi:putative adenylyltransferase/sulfurtransferase MoeZ [Falsiruegeria litorea R37]|uniref:Putative adenylyltransferase/sulfurtransferase MoeZ n=1 Tax=Falsiruegeria litorea R37 TaxID=1200284 RepID=A0A1Y5TTC0_9RHOB|nr:ThiF family adenylyltransferase [Falsiruegeria litorea]SLN69772.1 putative adenylyltransferase/sulfurtransferase MoeZ [Falsiruegeria litorea R37]
MNRYARQMILPQVGTQGQDRLSRARVLVVGCGGLAAPALPLLAGAGVGHLLLLDADVVALSNLHRQTLFTEADCDASKAEVAAGRCRAINSEITVEVRKQALTPANVAELVAKADLVLDCADSYAASYTLSDECLKQGKPLISASVLGLGGYVGGFCGGAPSLRAIFPEAPDSGASCATAGVLGPVVGMIGALQAQMALAVLLGMAPSPLGQMVQFDAQTYRSTAFRFEGAPEPETALRFAAPSELTDQDMIVELRGAEEAPEPIHASANRILPEEVQNHLPTPETRIALCCATGLRAWRTAERIQQIWPGEIVLVAAATS